MEGDLCVDVVSSLGVGHGGGSASGSLGATVTTGADSAIVVFPSTAMAGGVGALPAVSGAAVSI